MKYERIREGRFISRPNRFIALVEVEGEVCKVHVKNTGRCKEILVPGCTVYLSESDSERRSTKFDLVAAEKVTADKRLIINIDSQSVNTTAEEWLRQGKLFSDKAVLRREVRYKNSRFDFYVEDGEERCFLEVKGCTLEEGGVASFPDAPTERGIKHLNELVSCVADGFRAVVLFVIGMKGPRLFKPCDRIHPQFGDALRAAQNAGVEVYAIDCLVTTDSVVPDGFVKTEL